MTTSPELGTVDVLRGAAATGVPVARLDSELTSNRFSRGMPRDGRLADPSLDEAFAELAAEVRAAAQAEGYAVGWAAGHAEATAEVRAAAAQAEQDRRRDAGEARAAVAAALAALAAGAAALEQRAVVPAAELADALLDSAVELAETLLGRELDLAREPGLDALRRALSLAPVGRPVTARLNPADVPAVAHALDGMAPGELGREVHVVADPSVEPAGCVVECDATRVDAQLSPALARVREVLAS